MPSLALQSLGYIDFDAEPDPLQCLDLYYDTLPDKDTVWIVFIHGGAWRDPSNTSKDGSFLIESLPNVLPNNVKVAGASLNYRLSPHVKHPDHLSDIVAGLSMLFNKFDMTRYVLMGHSCGATLAFQSLQHVKLMPLALVATEGIYDISKLIHEYPDYESFVVGAFGADKDIWMTVSPTNIVAELNTTVLSRIELVQSKDDELLSAAQTELLCLSILKHLVPKGCMLVRHPMAGKHDEVLKNEVLCSIVHATMLAVCS